MNDELQDQFTKPRKKGFWLAIVAFCALGLGTFAYIGFSGSSTSESDVIASIQSQYATESTKIGDTTGQNFAQAQVESADDPWFGDPNAQVHIVEFGDFQCPYCQKSVQSVKDIQAAFGDRIFFQFRDFPIVSIHDQALNAAVAAECAHQQGTDEFWNYHDRLFQFQDELADDLYIPLAERVGLDMDEFTVCYKSQSVIDEIQDDYDQGIFAGVTGTPTFFINGYPVSGVIPSSVFIDIIDKILNEDY